MKKIRLDLEELQVESFETTPDNDPDKSEGTVYGNMIVQNTVDFCVSLPPVETCGLTCTCPTPAVTCPDICF